MKIPAPFAAAAVGLLWGSEWVLKVLPATSLSGLPPFRVLALRYFVAAIVLIPWVFPRRHQASSAEGFSIPLLPNVILGTVLIALPAMYLANRSDMSPGLVVLLFATVPLAASMFESSSGLMGAPALLGGLAGTAFLVRGSLSSSSSQALSLVGMTLIVVAIAAMLVRARKWLASAHTGASVMVQMLTAGCLFAFYSLIFEHAPAIAWTGGQMASVVVLGIFGSAAAYCLLYASLRELRASQVAVVQWLIPAVGIVETACWFRHLPEWGSLAGGLLAIGSAIAILQAPKQGDAPLTLQITDVAQGQNARDEDDAP